MRTAGTGRSAIVRSDRSSPAASAICVAAPAVAAAGKYVVGYTAMRLAGDRGGGISTRFDVMRAKSPTCCVRGCPSSATSGTPAKKSSFRSVPSGLSRNAAGTVACVDGTRTTYVPGINCESRNMPRSSVVAVGTSSGLTSMLPYRARPATTSLMSARTATPTTGSPASSSTVPAITPCFHTLIVTSVSRSPSARDRSRLWPKAWRWPYVPTE